MTPDRREWRVGRQWVPFRVRLHRDRSDVDFPSDLFDVDIFDDSGILAGLAIVASAVLLFLVIWPVIAIALEIVVLILVVLGGLAARVVLRRPWTVRAESRRGGGRTWRVVGWRASGALIEEVARALEEGRALPPMDQS